MSEPKSFETEAFIAKEQSDGLWKIYSKDDGAVLDENLVSFGQVLAQIARLDVTVGPRKGERSVFADLGHRLEAKSLAQMSPEEYSEYCEQVVKNFLPYRRAAWM